MRGNTARAAGSGGGGSASPSAINRAQRMAVLQNSVEMIQQIFSATLAAGTTTVNVPPRNVGLVKKFLVKITGTSNNTGGSGTSSLTDIGLANLLQSAI